MEVVNETISHELEKYYEDKWPIGTKPKLPQTYVRWPGSGPLSVSGDMRASMTKTTEDSVRVVSPYELRFGTSLLYARFVNDGTVKMQPRPFVRMTPAIKTIVIGTVREMVFGFTPDLRFTTGFRAL